jgi:hypothetical protein
MHMAADYVATPFTENAARVRKSCVRLSATSARCEAVVRADRARFRFTASIRCSSLSDERRQCDVYARRLRAIR